MSVEQLGQSVAELDVKSDNIQLSVRQIDERVGGAEATLSIHADEISSKVSKNGVISAINQSPEQISINASKINLVGAVTVLSDISGNLGTITAGTLRGVEIDIDTDATIGRTLFLTGDGDRSVVFKSGAIITTVPYGYAGLEISASDLYMNSGNIYIGGNPYTVYVRGNVDFSGATVKGLNAVAKFG